MTDNVYRQFKNQCSARCGSTCIHHDTWEEDTQQGHYHTHTTCCHICHILLIYATYCHMYVTYYHSYVTYYHIRHILLHICHIMLHICHILHTYRTMYLLMKFIHHFFSLPFCISHMFRRVNSTLALRQETYWQLTLSSTPHNCLHFSPILKRCFYHCRGLGFVHL